MEAFFPLLVCIESQGEEFWRNAYRCLLNLYLICHSWRMSVCDFKSQQKGLWKFVLGNTFQYSVTPNVMDFWNNVGQTQWVDKYMFTWLFAWFVKHPCPFTSSSVTVYFLENWAAVRSVEHCGWWNQSALHKCLCFGLVWYIVWKSELRWEQGTVDDEIKAPCFHWNHMCLWFGFVWYIVWKTGLQWEHQ